MKVESCFADELNTERARLHQSHHHADAPWERSGLAPL